MANLIGPPTVDYKDINNVMVMHIMTEGRSISTRRRAHVELANRLRRFENKMLNLEHQLGYRTDVNIARVSVSMEHRVFMVSTSNYRFAMYDERTLDIHVGKTSHNSEYRSGLEMVVIAVEKFGTDVQIYSDSEYVTRIVKNNILYWMNNGYKLTSGREARNKDLLEKLVSYNFNFNNLKEFTGEHQHIIDHVKNVYHDRNLNMSNVEVADMMLDTNVKVDNSDVMVSSDVSHDRLEISTPELLQSVDHMFADPFQTVLPVFKRNNRLRNQQMQHHLVQNMNAISYGQFQSQQSQHMNVSPYEHHEQQYSQSSSLSRIYDSNNL
jgi:hypothetical protein